jgi:hypothetical protein
MKMCKEPKSKRPKGIHLLEWLLSEDWVIADSHRHVAVDIDDIQRSFVAHFPDAPVPDSETVQILIEKFLIWLERSTEISMDWAHGNESEIAQNFIGDAHFQAVSDSGDAEKLIKHLEDTSPFTWTDETTLGWRAVKRQIRHYFAAKIGGKQT